MRDKAGSFGSWTRAEWADGGYCFDAAYPLRTTAYYASLIAAPTATDPIARQCLPRPDESLEWGSSDPLGEGGKEPLPGLVHVYADRALLLATDRCVVNCRHCNRRWRRTDGQPALDGTVVEQWLDYLRGQPQLREVLVTGGDPLTLPLAALERLLGRLRELPTQPVIRVGSRLPVVAPRRISGPLVRMLKGQGPLYLHTQFNCPAECTLLAGAALNRLADAGINLGNQMVLLAGVNDDAEVIGEVNRWLVRHRCRPYYLFLPEKVRGTSHFQVPPERALEIARELRRELSGLAMPAVVVDTPDGGGKVPLHEGGLVRCDGRLGVRDLAGRMVWL
jgi:lysine 2,3-aminomutase